MKKTGQEADEKSVSGVLIAKSIFIGLLFLTPLFFIITGVQSGEFDEKVVLIIAISLIVLIIACFIWYLVSKTRTNIKKQNTAEVKYKPYKSGFFSGVRDYLDIMSAFIPTFVVLLIILGLFWAAILHKDSTRIPYENQTAEDNQVERPVARIHHMQERSGTITWFKDGEKGSGVPTPIVVERNDDDVIIFTTKYGAHYKLNKRDNIGEWHQDYPRDSGKWNLVNPSEETTSFTGKISDNKTGIFIPMELELG